MNGVVNNISVGPVVQQYSELNNMFNVYIHADLKHAQIALALNFLVVLMNTLNSSKDISELSFENAGASSICYCKQRMTSKLSLFLRM